jgi:hypothetical protein
MTTKRKLSTPWLVSIVCALLLIGSLWPGVQPALAQEEEEEEVEADVLFLFETTSDMADFLVTAHDIAEKVIDDIADDCEPGFAVAQYRDWPPQSDAPWHLVQGVTLDPEPVVDAINRLWPDGVGDRPTSLGWALHSALGINWHADATKVIVIIGGAPPHDPDPGADGAYGTADDLLFADVLSELVAADVQVIGLYTHDAPDTADYFNAITDATTGKDAIRLTFPDRLSSVLRDTVCRTIAEADIEPPPSAPGGSLRGAVFHDANANHLWDAGEEGLPGIGVTVYSPTWESTGYTGDDGTYGVVALSASWWGVRIDVPDGWTATTPADRWGYLITEQGTIYFGIDFGLTRGEAVEAPAEEKAAEEAPFILPATGRASPAGSLWLIPIGLALAGAGLLLRRALGRRGLPRSFPDAHAWTSRLAAPLPRGTMWRTSWTPFAPSVGSCGSPWPSTWSPPPPS